MTETRSAADEAVLLRRLFLRGGALLAAAAGGAVAATAGSVLPARADTEAEVAVSFAVSPERIFDTRTSAGRESPRRLVASSPSAFDSSHRLKKNAWVDVAVVSTDDDLDVISVLVNLTSTKSTGGGSLVVTEPVDERPTGTTLSYDNGRTVSNGAIVGVAEVDGALAVRVYATSVTHVALDLTGFSAYMPPEPTQPVVRTTGRAGARRLTQAVRAARR